MQGSEIVPVFLGADLNCYSMARAFHEAFGVRSHAFARYQLGATKYSRIVKVRVVPELYEDAVMVDTLMEFAKENEGKQLYLFGCTDAYADSMIRNREKLSAYYFCPCPDPSLAEKLISKASFYQLCDAYAIEYPRTVVLKKTSDFRVLSELPFAYPIIIKPSSSIDYWLHPFDGMKKVYRAGSPVDAERIVKMIFASGYQDQILLQDFIPGDDSEMYVLTTYSDKTHSVRLMCMGHVLLEEHTPKGRGNHTAILTEYHPEIMHRLADFLNAVGYCGFANFDMKLDARDGKMKVLEINLRQGRSNYYVTQSGYNLALYPVWDRENARQKSPDEAKAGSFWHTVPKRIIYSYIKDARLKIKLKSLRRRKREGTALYYRWDLLQSPLRFFYVVFHDLRYYAKYKKYP